MGPTRVAPIVRRRAELLGERGSRWLDGLDDLIDRLADEWRITAGEPLTGGTGSVVLRARTDAGTDAVLKLEVPDPGTLHQGSVLDRAAGRGHVQILRHDPERRAMLLEALGPTLRSRGLPPDEELRLLADLLRQAWRRPDTEPSRQDAEQKAVDLADLVRRLSAEVEHVPSAAVELALDLAERRRRGADGAVIVHGDPHPQNALQVLRPRPGAELGYVFVDPDGLVAEPAYDLGVVLRERGVEDGASPALVRRWCLLLAERTRVDPVAAWEWSLVERVSTGLLLLRLGSPALGRRYLAAAERLADEGPA